MRKTVVDVYRIDKDGNILEYINKGIHNACGYGSRISELECFFGVDKNDHNHKPFKNFECFQINKSSKWGAYTLDACEVEATYAAATPVTPDEIDEMYGTGNQRRVLWFNIGNGGAKLTSVSKKLQSTFNFNTTLYNCIPFRLTDEPLAELEASKYGICLKLTFSKTATKQQIPVKYAYYCKVIGEVEKILERKPENPFDPENADTDMTDSIYVTGDQVVEKDIVIGLRTYPTIDSNEVVEYYEFLNGTSSGAYTNEIGFMLSNVKKIGDDRLVIDWDDCELYAHLKTNTFDMSESASSVRATYTFYPT